MEAMSTVYIHRVQIGSVRNVEVDMDRDVSLEDLDSFLKVIETRKHFIRERFSQFEIACTRMYRLPKVLAEKVASYVWHPQLRTEEKAQDHFKTAVLVTAIFRADNERISDSQALDLFKRERTTENLIFVVEKRSPRWSKRRLERTFFWHRWFDEYQ